MKKHLFSGSSPAGRSLFEEFKGRYEDYTGAVHVEVDDDFDSVDMMKQVLLNDLNDTQGQICGNYMGKFMFRKGFLKKSLR